MYFVSSLRQKFENMNVTQSSVSKTFAPKVNRFVVSHLLLISTYTIYLLKLKHYSTVIGLDYNIDVVENGRLANLIFKEAFLYNNPNAT